MSTVVDATRVSSWGRCVAASLLSIAAGCYEGVEPPSASTEAGTDGSGSADDGTPDDGDGDGDGRPDDGGIDDGIDDAPSDDGSSADDGPLDDGDSSGGPGNDDGGGISPEVQAMCMRWNSDRADLAEGTWSGSVGSCNPGDISANGRANALKLVNLYRWLADLPPVDTDPSRNSMAQACALIMDANNSLSHDPPQSWACWTTAGDTAAGSSNISTGPGVMSVDMYMVDWGNQNTLGHRRWIMSNSLGPIGLGSTSDSSCMWVIGGSGSAAAAWTAFPPPGPFPIEAFSPLPFGDTLDQTGWSIQSDSIDLTGAQVTITVDGENKPVSVTTLWEGYGSDTAISIIPQGWTTQPGLVYHVEVVGKPIAYDVEIVDCDAI